MKFFGFYLLLLLSFSLSAQTPEIKEEETNATAPEFPGGQIRLNDYLDKHLVYPKRAKKKRLEGKVFAQFAVEEDGTLTSIRISKSLSKECDEEVIRLLKNSPKWIPATENGKPVKNWMVLPIEFSLKKWE
jgi:periplasmic protein TonB